MRIACLGDSITAGYPTCQEEIKHSYPKFLQGLLNTSEKSKFDVLNFGVCGQTMQDIPEYVAMRDELAYKSILTC